jgi:transposase
MDLAPIYSCVAALDVHQAKLSVCLLYTNDRGEAVAEIKEFGGFRRDRRAMAAWVASFHPEVVVMESTGIYWKSPYAALEQVGVRALVVNARHVKTVPGRKTDICDAQWLAILARAGLLTGSFVPPANMRELRLIARQLTKLTGIQAAELNRLHKVLTDGGIRLSVVVSDLHGRSAWAMIKALVAGETPEQVLGCVSTRLRASEQELRDAVEGDLSDAHRFVLAQLVDHVEDLERRIGCFRERLLDGLKPQAGLLVALQTLPGFDELAAALLIVEIGDDMQAFGTPEKLASWAGLCPGNHESAGKRHTGKSRKGNPYVRRLLCEAAQAASRTRCALAERFRSLLVRRGRKRAIFALAHQLLKLVFVLIDRGDHYRDATVDYEALSVARNAPRWMKMLKKHGFIAA